MNMIQRTYDNVNTFYADAQKVIMHNLAAKLRTLGVYKEDLPELLNAGLINKYSSDNIDGIIVEMYEYNGIRLLEIEWTASGVTQRDINKDERELRRDI